MTIDLSLQLKIHLHLSGLLKVSKTYIFIEITKKKTTVEHILSWNIELVIFNKLEVWAKCDDKSIYLSSYSAFCTCKIL